MATLTVNGRKVTVDDSFKSLSPEQQDSTVNEIAASFSQFDAGQTVTGIPAEMSRTAGEHWKSIQDNLLNNPQQSAVGGLLDTGKGLLSAATAIPDILVGAPARSILGRGGAQLSHTIGSVVNPDVAAKDDPNKMYEDWRGNVDTAMSAIAPRGASPAALRTVPATKPTGAELKDAGRAVYRDPSVSQLPIPSADVTGMASGLENNLLRQGFRPSAASAPSTFAELRGLTPQAGQSVIVDDLRAARRAFSKIAEQRGPDFNPTPDAAAATQAVREIDNLLGRADPRILEANANYAAGSTAERLDFRRMKAEHRADKSGTGGNLENTMRQEVDKLSDRGLTPAERKLRDSIVRGTFTRNRLREAGKLGIDGGLSLLLHAGAGLGSGGATVPIAVAGTIARKTGEALTKSQINRLSEMIRGRSPLGQQPTFTVPQANRLAKALSASLVGRSAPNGLLQAIQAYADQEQQ